MDDRAQPGVVGNLVPSGGRLVDAPGAGGGNGQTQRRARTHEALLAAGRQLVAQGSEDASIEEITRLAGVGFGSFANHFPGGKATFFHQAALGLLAHFGGQIGAVTARVDDPVVAVAMGFRATARLARREPAMSAVLLRPGSDVLFAAETLLDAAGHDLERGQQTGQFVSGDRALLLVAMGSVLIGTLRLLDGEQGAGNVVPLAEEVAIDEACAAVLRLLGVDADRAREVSRAPLDEA